ncbi:MAG: hypothetical protein ACHP79_09295 [Terriglobales bacterium]
MKVAQLMATIPDLLPSDYAAELTKLQSDAPATEPKFFPQLSKVILTN